MKEIPPMQKSCSVRNAWELLILESILEELFVHFDHLVSSHQNRDAASLYLALQSEIKKGFPGLP